MYHGLGFDLLNTLKSAAAAGVKATKAEILKAGGTAIAATPEGQQAIQDSVLDRARQRATEAFTTAREAVPLPVLLGVAGLALWFLLKRRRG